MTLVPEIMQISAETGVTLARTAQSYFGVTQNLRDRPAAGGRRTRFGNRAIRGHGAVAQHQRHRQCPRASITIAALADKKAERNPVGAWQDSDREPDVNRITDQLTQLTEKGETTLAKITVAAGLLSDLAQDRAR